MGWQDIRERLLGSLQQEVRGHWGRISEIESRLGLSKGYLNKLVSGRKELKLDLFLRAIDALGLDHRKFMAEALQICPEPEDFLRQVETPGEGAEAALSKLEQAVESVLSSESLAPEPASGADASDVAQFADRPRQEQLRRMQHGKRYRTHAFARAYLDHLDQLRASDAEEAARLAVGVTTRLIPALPGPAAERQGLLCLALGVFGSARRVKGKYTSSARTFRLALKTARQAGIREDLANLLMRASYLLRDFGQYDRAKKLLDEALVIFVQLDCRKGMGRALVDHGMMDYYSGNYQIVVQGIERALGYLEGSEEELRRYHLAAYQLLAGSFEHLGDSEAAHRWLDKGAKAASCRVDQAKLSWLAGSLAYRQGRFRRSEELLVAARDVISRHENTMQEAGVTLDLLGSMLALGKNQEACRLASSMVRLIKEFSNNPMAEVALVELIRASMAGQMNEALIAEARSQLQGQSNRQNGARRGSSAG